MLNPTRHILSLYLTSFDHYFGRMVEIFLVEQSLKLRLKLYDKHLNKHLIKSASDNLMDSHRLYSNIISFQKWTE